MKDEKCSKCDRPLKRPCRNPDGTFHRPKGMTDWWFLYCLFCVVFVAFVTMIIVVTIVLANPIPIGTMLLIYIFGYRRFSKKVKEEK